MNENQIRLYFPIVINLDGYIKDFEIADTLVKTYVYGGPDVKQQLRKIIFSNEIFPSVRKLKALIRLLDFLHHYPDRDYLKYKESVFKLKLNKNKEKVIRRIKMIFLQYGVSQGVIEKLTRNLYNNVDELKLDVVVIKDGKLMEIDNVIDVKKVLVRLENDFKELTEVLLDRRKYQERLRYE